MISELSHRHTSKFVIRNRRNLGYTGLHGITNKIMHYRDLQLRLLNDFNFFDFPDLQLTHIIIAVVSKDTSMQPCMHFIHPAKNSTLLC